MDQQSVQVRYTSRRVVLSSSRAEGNELTLFVPTEQSVSPGAPLRLYCSFGDSDRSFVLVGTSIFRRAEPTLGQNRGVVIRFADGDEKRAAAEMLAFCAGRSPDQGTSGAQRVTTAISCVVVLGGQRFPAEVRDLSSNGVFVASARLSALKSGTQVLLHLNPSWFGLRGPKLQARLIWSGRKNGRVGFGARFTQDPAVVRPALRDYLRDGTPLPRH